MSKAKTKKYYILGMEVEAKSLLVQLDGEWFCTFIYFLVEIGVCINVTMVSLCV